MIVLGNNVGEVIMRSGSDNIKLVLGARCVVAVNVLDRTHIAVRQSVGSRPENGMFPMQLLKILRPGTCMCKNHERQIGDARKRMETGILTEAYVGQHTYCGAPSLAKELLTVDIAKVNYDWVYNNIKENAGAQSRSVRARKNRDRHQKGRAAVLCFAELEALDLFLAERRPTVF